MIRSFAHRSLVVASTATTRSSGRRTMSSSSTPDFPVERSIVANLQSQLQPLHHLEVINESHRHNVPAHSETHFKVLVVSEQFDAVKSIVQRHRLVNAALAEQLAGPVHALSIVAKSPSQWESMVAQGKTSLAPSPNCQGGDGSLPPKK